MATKPDNNTLPPRQHGNTPTNAKENYEEDIPAVKEGAWDWLDKVVKRRKLQKEQNRRCV